MDHFRSLRQAVDKAALRKIVRLAYLFGFIYIAALVAKPSPYRRLYFLPLFCIAIYALSISTGVPFFDYYIGAGLFITLFAASDFILLTEIQRELYLVNSPQRIEDAQLGGRFSWAMKLLADGRGLGWTHEPRHAIPPRPPASTPRWLFVLSRLTHAFCALLLAELINIYNLKNTPALYSGGPSLAGDSLWERYTNVLRFGVPFISLVMVFPDALLDSFSVATGTTRPEDCPPTTGSLTLLWSIRNFWSRVWHQKNRRFLSSHGKFLAHRVLRFQRGSVASAYTQLFVAFFVSGVMHYFPEYMALRHWGGGGLRFFVLQAVGISVEESIVALGRRLGLERWPIPWKLLGYFWVWTWFAFTAPRWLDPLLHVGVFEPFFHSWVILPLMERP
ncbi:membrane bound O-acyl transferase family-domain-containing protein [Mycena amicta]|nr:membrane bound O-acyl transferase family-domain-containing protein [Mycena amicta]